MTRIPIIRRDADGTVVDGTARARRTGSGLALDDFRDLDGGELVLEPGASFEVQLSGGPGEGDGPSILAQVHMPATDDASCRARIRPLRPTDDAEVACTAEGPHELHAGELRDFAYPGSVTQVEWLPDDRRSFTDAWPGPCPLTPGCILPANHPRSCAP